MAALQPRDRDEHFHFWHFKTSGFITTKLTTMSKALLPVHRKVAIEQAKLRRLGNPREIGTATEDSDPDSIVLAKFRLRSPGFSGLPAEVFQHSILREGYDAQQSSSSIFEIIAHLGTHRLCPSRSRSRSLNRFADCRMGLRSHHRSALHC